MNNPLNNPLFSAFAEDARHRQLVEKLIERIVAGRLIWTRTPTTYEAALKNGTRIAFVA